MKSLFILTLVVILALCTPLFAQTTQLQYAKTCGLTAMSDSFTATAQLIAAPPAGPGAVYIGGVATANPIAPRIKICTVRILVKQTTTAANFGLITGTGTNCATGAANLTPQWLGTISVIDNYDGRFDAGGALPAPAGKAVCVKLSAAPTQAQALITYKIE